MALTKQKITPYLILIFAYIITTDAADDELDNTGHIVFEVLNTIMVSILFIYGVFLIFAIIQSYYWRGEWGPLWLFIPNVFLAWMPAICFYIYLGINTHQHKVLLLSISQFQWIFNNTYSLFVTIYIGISSHIYEEYDDKTAKEFHEKTLKLPQNKYLVHGLFRSLRKGKSFSNWRYETFETLPTLPDDILNVSATFIDNDLYEFTPINLEQRQNERDRFAKAFTYVASVVTALLILFISAWNDTDTLHELLIFILVMDVMMFIGHIVFSVCTIKVLLYHGNKIAHLRKYKVSLVFSWFSMICEFILLSLFLQYGVRDDLWSINIFILLHSVGLLGWYTTWIIESVYVSLEIYE